MSQKAIDQVQVGFKASFSKTITEEDVRKFAEVSGDFNPLHLDAEYAKKTVFGDRIAHGILTLGLVSTSLTRLPGTVVYVSQNARFLKPVRLGDTIEAIAEIMSKTIEKNEVSLHTSCRNQRGEQVLDGEARVRLFDLK